MIHQTAARAKSTAQPTPTPTPTPMAVVELDEPDLEDAVADDEAEVKEETADVVALESLVWTDHW